MAYKSTLLSSLIQIRYESPIDTPSDLDNSGMHAIMAADKVFDKVFATDPRDAMKNMQNRTIIYAYNGSVPQEIWTM